MQTPRPDLYTYPTHGYPAEKTRRVDSTGGEFILKKSWMRALFIGGLVGVVALGFALSLGT
jgi:hypothetical protein